MRLLHSSTYELREFIGSNIPPYAILSHTWGGEEILFQDLKQSHEVWKAKKSYPKIRGCCEQAARDGLEWVWIDTCCIDKSSSAELSEAINSMFQWYQDSIVCYAFLEDVVSCGFALDESELAKAKWFTRGWTLQEFLAPWQVYFYSRDWQEIGTKKSLCDLLSRITGIDDTVIRAQPGDGRWKSLRAATRMSWMAARETSREEDMAYCLLGIFDIHMPLLYGEGPHAFIRLQEEILKQHGDYTLLCWVPPRGIGDGGIATLPGCGVLADSPARFDPRSAALYDRFRSMEVKFDFTILRRFEPDSLGEYDLVNSDSSHSESKFLKALAECVNGAEFGTPVITKRGLESTMLVSDKVNNKDDRELNDGTWLVWTFCTTWPTLNTGEALLCFRTRSKTEEIGSPLNRLGLPFLEVVPLEAISLFSPRKLRLAVSSPTIHTAGQRNPWRLSSSEQAGQSVRVLFSSPDFVNPSSMDLWPPKNTAIPLSGGWEVQIKEFGHQLIILNCEVNCPGGPRWLLVIAGIGAASRPFCHIELCSTSSAPLHDVGSWWSRGAGLKLTTDGNAMRTRREKTDRMDVTLGSGQIVSAALKILKHWVLHLSVQTVDPDIYERVSDAEKARLVPLTLRDMPWRPENFQWTPSAPMPRRDENGRLFRPLPSPIRVKDCMFIGNARHISVSDGMTAIVAVGRVRQTWPTKLKITRDRELFVGVRYEPYPDLIPAMLLVFAFVRRCLRALRTALDAAHPTGAETPAEPASIPAEKILFHRDSGSSDGSECALLIACIMSEYQLSLDVALNVVVSNGQEFEITAWQMDQLRIWEQVGSNPWEDAERKKMKPPYASYIKEIEQAHARWVAENPKPRPA